MEKGLKNDDNNLECQITLTMVKKKMIVDLDDKNYFNAKGNDPFDKGNYILEAFKYFKTYLENENLICMYMSY